VRRWRLFLVSAAVLTGMWAIPNLPRDGGTLKSELEWAGFPWTFAFWEDGKLRWFDSAALAADVATGLAMILPVAWLCAWSKSRSTNAPVAAEPVRALDRGGGESLRRDGH
jgi:hypothetical protein